MAQHLILVLSDDVELSPADLDKMKAELEGRLELGIILLGGVKQALLIDAPAVGV